MVHDWLATGQGDDYVPSYFFGSLEMAMLLAMHITMRTEWIGGRNPKHIFSGTARGE